MNELMVTMNGWVYFKTSEQTVEDAVTDFADMLRGIGVNLDNLAFTAVLRDEDGNDISSEIECEP